MRLRDFQRMTKYNERQHQNRYGDSNWANQVRNSVEEEEAQVRPPRQQPRSQSPRPQQRWGPPAAPNVTKETPAKDEQLYLGNGRGSKPVKKTLGQNFDCTGFVPLVQQVYDRMCIKDQRISRSLPLAIFQHAMTEFLVAYQLHHAKYVLKATGLQSMMDPLAAISAEEYNIPQPIYEYICGFGPNITPTGDKVYWNLPKVAIPKGTHEHSNIRVRPGTFGSIDSANHNAYEYYLSPYVTSAYIKKSAKVTPTTRSLNWDPFPTGWKPANCVPNENLLGYKLRQRQHPDSIPITPNGNFIALPKTGKNLERRVTGQLCRKTG